MVGKLLVFRPGAMGDLLLTLPALELLHRKRPETQIHLVAHPSYIGLALQAGFISAVRSYDDAFFTPLFSDDRTLPSPLSDYLSSFDAALCYLDDPRGTVRRGLTAAGVKSVVLSDPNPPPGVHISQHLAGAVRLLGISGTIRPAPLTPFPAEVQWARGFIGRSFGNPDAPFVAMHPGAGGVRKRWPVERFAFAARALFREYALAALIITGPAETDALRDFEKLASHIPTAFSTEPDMDTLAALISLASLYIGNDSGPTHLAAALGVPVVALFGPTDPSRWRPLGDNVRVLHRPSGCSPCDRETRKRCKRGICMEGISVAEVLSAARSFLSASGTRSLC